MIDCLPDSAKNIVRLIGLDKAMLLIDRLGGSTISVASRHNGLAEIIGHEATDILTREYAGENLYIPNCKAVLRRARDSAIRARFDALVKSGCSANKAVAALSREHGISDRRVWIILKASGAAGSR